MFPVNANGEVLFLSVASFGRAGNVFTPIVNLLEDLELVAGPFSIVLIRLLIDLLRI
ncbi:hypothetical protein DFH82_001660 [Clostridium saccharobutylicum]|nr:hypothetical protein [Clostridium saccharobutylicum]